MFLKLNTKSNSASLLQTTEIIAPIPRAVYSVLCAFTRVCRQATALAGVWFVHQINANPPPFLFLCIGLDIASTIAAIVSRARAPRLQAQVRRLHDCHSAAAASIIVDPPTGASLSCLSAISQRTGAVLCADAVSVAESHNRRRAGGRGWLSLPLRSGMQKNSSAQSSLREHTPPPFIYAHANQSSAFSSSPAVDSELNVREQCRRVTGRWKTAAHCGHYSHCGLTVKFTRVR